MSVFFWATVVFLFTYLTVFTIQKFFRKISPASRILTLCLYLQAAVTIVHIFTDRFCLLKRYLGDFAQTYCRVFWPHELTMSVFFWTTVVFLFTYLTIFTIQKFFRKISLHLTMSVSSFGSHKCLYFYWQILLTQKIFRRFGINLPPCVWIPRC